MMFKTSLISDLEYRANFITRVFTDIFWYLSQILMFEAIYQHVNKVGSFGILETRVFLGLVFVIDAFYMIFIHENIENLPTKVSKGDLDLQLVKPVNSQFMLSLQKANTAIFSNLILGIAWLTYALFGYYQQFDWHVMVRILSLLIYIPCGVCIVYSFRILFAMTSIVFVKSESLQYLWWNFYRLGMRPDSMYIPWMRMILLTFIPMSVIVSVPARIVLGIADGWMFFIPIGISLILLLISKVFWDFSLKRYSSASS